LVTVSVVIPSRNRPGLVGRAVRSALGQTLRDVEAVVVLDGKDPASVAELGRIEDPRLRVVELPESVGAQEARNAGVEASRGEWVAFLDDDDEWRPEKLDKQVAAARASGLARPIVSCALVSRTPSGEEVWPKRGPHPGETVAQYLFRRHPNELAEIRLQTSTLLTRRDLLGEVRWRPCAHDEWDLLLRAAAVEGAGLVHVDEPLTIWTADAGRDRLSYKLTRGWRATAEWFREVRPLVDEESYASFLLSTLSLWARLRGDWPALFTLPVEAVRLGRPSASLLASHFGRWFLPKSLRSTLKRSLPLRTHSTRS
jgi:glycosyltransferase involved in cell wall biosynthesis